MSEYSKKAKDTLDLLRANLEWVDRYKKYADEISGNITMLKERKHHMLFWATVAARPVPDYRRCFHTGATGDDAPFCLSSDEMDAAISAVESAQTPTETQRACAAVDSLIYRLAIWLPAWMENRAHVATWPHVNLPQSGYRTYDVVDSHLLWISPH